MPRFSYIVRLIDGNAIPVTVAAPSEEEANESAVLKAGRFVGQDIGHLVTEVEGTDL